MLHIRTSFRLHLPFYKHFDQLGQQLYLVLGLPVVEEEVKCGFHGLKELRSTFRVCAALHAIS